MDGKEVTRTFGRIESLIAGVHTKLDKMPDWEDIDRQEARRDAEQKKQDEAIKAVEGKINGLMMAVIVASLGAAASIVGQLTGTG